MRFIGREATVRPGVPRFRLQDQAAELVRPHVQFDRRSERLADANDVVIPPVLPRRFRDRRRLRADVRVLKFHRITRNAFSLHLERVDLGFAAREGVLRDALGEGAVGARGIFERGQRT